MFEAGRDRKEICKFVEKIEDKKINRIGKYRYREIGGISLYL
jgi:hypothetical protein